MFINNIFFSYLTLNFLRIIQCTKGGENSYILLYVSESDDGFMKCMELSLEDWFPILPRSWLHLYSMPVALWPLVLLWCGRQKHKPGWSGEREGWGIAKGETVYNGRGGLRFFLWCRFQRGMRGRDEGVQKEWCEFARSCAIRWSHHLTDLWGFALRAGWWWVGRKEAGLRERDRLMVGGWERARRWLELIETSAPLQ